MTVINDSENPTPLVVLRLLLRHRGSENPSELAHLPLPHPCVPTPPRFVVLDKEF